LSFLFVIQEQIGICGSAVIFCLRFILLLHQHVRSLILYGEICLVNRAGLT